MVKAGYGAKVAPFVKPATVVDITKENRDLSPNFLRWLTERNLSSDDCIMRLKEGYAIYCSACSLTLIYYAPILVLYSLEINVLKPFGTSEYDLVRF